MAAAERQHRHAADAVADEYDRAIDALDQPMQVFRKALDIEYAVAEGGRRP
jgi:hypothetical protein